MSLPPEELICPEGVAYGIDLHARSLYVCVVSAEGEILVQRKIPARPEARYSAGTVTAFVAMSPAILMLDGPLRTLTGAKDSG